MESLVSKKKSLFVCLVEMAQTLEQSHDLDEIGKLLAGYWDEIETDPDFAKWSPALAAALYRVAGFYLSLLGRAQNKENYLLRGKELLSKAMHLFELLGERDLANEARNKLGLSYQQQGLLEDAAPFFLEVMANYETDRLNVNYLQAATNFLLVLQFRGDFTQANNIISEIEVPVEVSENVLLKITFHLQSAMILRRSDNTRAFHHFEECSRFCRAVGSRRSLAINLNNQSFLFLDNRQFAAAHRALDEAAQIFRAAEDYGWLGDCLDSKAQVYLAEGKPDRAVEYSNQAVELLAGCDKTAHINALWVNVRCLLQEGYKVEAIEKFGKLIKTADLFLGEDHVRTFLQKFSELIEIKHIGYHEAKGAYKKSLIIDAFKTHRHDFAATAQCLRESENALAVTINQQFPELWKQLGIEPYQIQKEENIEEVVKDVNILHLDHAILRFAPDCEAFDEHAVRTYYFAASVMRTYFRHNTDAIVAVKQQLTVTEKTLFLIKLIKEEKYFIGQIYYDKLLNLHYFIDSTEMISHLADSIKVIGSPFAYCPLAEIDQDLLYFNPLLRL